MKRILACSVAATAFLFRAMAADVPNGYDGTHTQLLDEPDALEDAPH